VTLLKSGRESDDKTFAAEKGAVLARPLCGFALGGGLCCGCLQGPSVALLLNRVIMRCHSYHNQDLCLTIHSTYTLVTPKKPTDRRP
jgi:hypothetical protein